MAKQFASDSLKCITLVRTRSSRLSNIRKLPQFNTTKLATSTTNPAPASISEESSKEAFHVILSRPSWTQILDRSAPTPDPETIKEALDELVPFEESTWKKVDYLVEQLIFEGKNELAIDLLEVSVECDLAKDPSFSNYFIITTRCKSFDTVAEVGMKWILSNQKRFGSYAANTLLYCAHVSHRADKSYELLKLMHNRGMDFDDDYPYSIAIHTCNEDKKWNESLEIFEMFKTLNKKPSPILIRNSLHTFQAKGRKDLLAGVVDDIETGAISMSMSLFKVLMETSRELSDAKSAMRIFKMGQERRMNLSIWALNSILVIFKDNAVFPSLDKCFLLIKQMNMKPDAFTFGLLFGAANRTCQSVQIIDQLIQECRIWEIPFNTIMLHSAVMAYRRAIQDQTRIRIKKCKELLGKYDCADQACYSVVFVLCVESHDLESAFNVMTEMESKDYTLTRTQLMKFGEKCEKHGLKKYAYYVKGQLMQRDMASVQSK
eukprot:g8896.t1